MALLQADIPVKILMLCSQIYAPERRCSYADPECSHEEPGAKHRTKPVWLQRHDPIVAQHCHDYRINDDERWSNHSHTLIATNLFPLLTHPAPCQPSSPSFASLASCEHLFGTETHIRAKSEIDEIQCHPEEESKSKNVPCDQEWHVQVSRFVLDDNVVRHHLNPRKIALTKTQHGYHEQEREREKCNKRLANPTYRPIPFCLCNPGCYSKQKTTRGHAREVQPVRDIADPCGLRVLPPSHQERQKPHHYEGTNQKIGFPRARKMAHRNFIRHVNMGHSYSPAGGLSPDMLFSGAFPA